MKKFLIGFLAWSMVLSGIGLALIALPVLLAHFQKLPALQHRYVGVLGIAISIAYWNWRYVRGDLSSKSTRSRREPLDSPFAGFLFLVPILLGLSLYTPGDKNVLASTGYLVGWIAAAGLVIAMVVIRGHERKLHGVYRGQTRWLKDNNEEVSTFLGVTPANVAISSQPLRVDIAVADVKVASAQPGVLTALKRLLSSKQ